MSAPPPPARASAIARLLAPVGLDAFMESHWERAPLHVGRDRPEHFADLISVAAIEAALSRGGPRYPDAQLVRAGTPVAPDDYTDASGRVLARPAARHHRAGATLVLSQAHRGFDALAAFVRELHAALGWRCQANAYLSPPGNSGFAPHHDTHDVFVLQVAGGKTFRFYTGGVDLPFSDERYDPAQAGERTAGESIELGPGDTLYIPRGVAHDAVAHPDRSSLHVTVGVFPAVLRDVLLEAVQVAAERDVALRASVPREAWTASGNGAEAAGSLRAALGAASGASPAGDGLSAILSDDVLAEALSRLRDAAAISGTPDAAGLLAAASGAASGADGSDPSAPDAPDIGAALVVEGVAPAAAERVGTRVKVRRAGEVLELGEPMASAAETLLRRGRVPVAELGGADDDARRALARRLVGHGLCRAVPR